MYEIKLDYTIETGKELTRAGADWLADYLSRVIADVCAKKGAWATGTVEVVEADDDETDS